MRVRRPGRLFWKMLIALWASVVISFAATALLFHLAGVRPPTGQGTAIFPFFPLVPLAIGAATMVVVCAGLAWYLARPLADLRWALRQASKERFDTRVQPRMGTRRDEIADLAREFDQMASHLQRLTESRRTLLHDISHELRSPLTRMQAAIGLMRQAPERMPKMLARLEGEAGRLNELIGELLTLHRLEAGAQSSRERVDVIELLQAIAEDAHFEAQAAGRAVAIAAPRSFVVDVNGELIYRALENVIRNAVKFSPAGGLVEIDAWVDDADGALVCHVLDRGPGLPPDMLNTIFEPFTRVESQNNPGGFGLGLAIAKRAIEAHGGCISASERPGRGLDITIVLPGNLPSDAGRR